MSNKPSNKVLTVIDNQQLTPNMQRIRFQADNLSDFPSDAAGGYIKLLFTEQGDTDISMLGEDERPKMRTYTISNLHKALNQLDVDFVRHEHLVIDNDSGGFAAVWSQSVSIGDTISIAGPGMIKPVNIDTDWYFLVADMTALPALSAQLAKLPTAASGYAVIEINHKDDKQTLVKPEGIEIIWVVTDEAKTNLLTQVKALTWQQGEVSVWCACEFSDMRALRVYFRSDKSVDKDNIYISSYWKTGCTEDGHKIAKRDDNLAEDSLTKERAQS